MQQQNQRSFDIYEHVTNTIIALLEEGTVPWRRPWITSGPPRNLLTRHWYTGINHVLLNALPYEQPFYLTFRQLKAMAASVKKGERGYFIVFRKTIREQDKIDKTKTVSRSVLRYYHVFNIAQCDNIPPQLIPNLQPMQQHKDPIQECEFVVEDFKTCPTIKYGEPVPYYVAQGDYVNLPRRERFAKQEHYYATLFHELIHSTGHESRLNRKEIMENPAFGTELYSIEELTAEIGACYLNSFCGIESQTIENNAAYINNWLTALRNDKKFIVQASTRAQRAVDYILNIDRSTINPDTMPAEQAGV